MYTDFFNEIDRDWENNLTKLIDVLIDMKDYSKLDYVLDNYKEKIKEINISNLINDDKINNNLLDILYSRRMFNIINATIIAEKNNSFVFMEWAFNENILNLPFLALCACNDRNNSILRWIFIDKKFMDENIIYRILENENYEFFNCLCDSVKINFDIILKISVKYNNEKIIQYLIEKNLITKNNVLIKAIEHDNLKLFNAYIDSNLDIQIYNDLAIFSENNSNETITLELINRGANNYEELIRNAIINNHIKIVDLLLEKIKDKKLLNEFLELAEENKRYIIKNKLNKILNIVTFSKKIEELNKKTIKYAYNGNLDMIEYMFEHENIDNYQDIADVAAFIGNKDIIAFCAKNFELDVDRLCQNAIEGDKIDILKYLIDRFNISKSNILNLAFQYERQNIIEWLLKEKELLIHYVYLGLYFNRIDIIKKYISQVNEITKDILNASILYRFHDIMRYILESNSFSNNDYNLLAEHSIECENIYALNYIDEKSQLDYMKLLKLSIEKNNNDIINHIIKKILYVYNK